MGGMNEYNKGYKSGYGTGSPRIPTTFTESVGYNAGKAQRDRETQARRPNEPQAAGASIGRIPLLILLCIGAMLVMGMVVVVAGSPVLKLFYPAAAVFGLVVTPRVRRVLGVATPIYIGACIGMLLGCLELAVTSSQLNLHNLIIYIFFGAMLGALGVPVAVLRRK